MTSLKTRLTRELSAPSYGNIIAAIPTGFGVPDAVEYQREAVEELKKSPTTPTTVTVNPETSIVFGLKNELQSDTGYKEKFLKECANIKSDLYLICL